MDGKSSFNFMDLVFIKFSFFFRLATDLEIIDDECIEWKKDFFEVSIKKLIEKLVKGI